MAAGDVVKAVDLLLGDQRKKSTRIVAGTVTLDGGNPTPIDLSGELTSIYAAVVSIEGSAATAADPNQVTSGISGTTLNIYAWKITTGGAAGDPTEIASTNNARLVNFIAIGQSV